MKTLIVTDHFKHRVLERQVFVTEEVVRRLVEDKSGTVILYGSHAKMYFVFKVNATEIICITAMDLDRNKDMIHLAEQHNAELVVV